MIRYGHAYPAMLIGDKWWFADDLRTEQYLNGDTTPLLPRSQEWRYARSRAQAVYRTDTAMFVAYGRPPTHHSFLLEGPTRFRSPLPNTLVVTLSVV